MKKFIFLLLPLIIFGYYDFSLRKYADVSELLEDSYTDYYLNPAVLTELKERFLSFVIYGRGGEAQFTNLNFLNINKIFPYAIILSNFKTKLSSENSITLLYARKRKDYSYGFKFQIGKIKNFYEEISGEEGSEYVLERDGPVFDSTSEDFYFEDNYYLEKTFFKTFNHYQSKSNTLLFPFAFYLKFKDLELGIDLKNSLERRVDKYKEEEEGLEIEEDYEFIKEGDTVLKNWEENLNRYVEFGAYREEKIDSLKTWDKDISLFLRKKFRGIRDKKILFARIGYSFEIIKGNTYEKSFDSSYESLFEWWKEYEDEEGGWYSGSHFYEESEGAMEESKIIIDEKKENLYQEGGFGFNYHLSFLKLDNTIFLGIKEKIDLVKREEWEKRGKVSFYLGNNFEIGRFSFFPIFIPSWTMEEDKNEDKIKISYNYQCFFDLKFKIFDFLTWRFSYLLPGEKEVSKRWVLSLYLNY